MTIFEMQKRLSGRGLRMQCFESEAGQPWVVWLSCEKDPGLGVITGEGREIEEAFSDAIKQWDGMIDDEEGEEEVSGDGKQFSLNPVR